MRGRGLVLVKGISKQPPIAENSEREIGQIKKYGQLMLYYGPLIGWAFRIARESFRQLPQAANEMHDRV